MNVTDLNLKYEIAKVQTELIFFRDRCLPAFLDREVDDSLGEEYAEWVREKIQAVAGQLSGWQRATNRLSDFLPLGSLAPDSPDISREEFKEFLFQDAKPSMSMRDGRIIWKIELYMSPDFCVPSCPSCPVFPTDLEKFQARLPDVQHWLMSFPVDSIELYNALCTVLPFIADADPAFAKLALDLDTWRDIVIRDSDITDDVRTKWLRRIEGYFGHVLNNSLLHILGSLANNHFLLIGDFLDHPRLRGGYAHLKPHYLFAVLLEKVAMLRQLGDDRQGLWEVSSDASINAVLNPT
jgi:hypothetical protein